MHGELEKHDGRWRLQFVRRLPHRPEKVWRALTEPEHLAAWFPARIEGDRAAGAKLRFVFPHDGAPIDEGEMLACEPPTLLEFRWTDETFRFEVRPDGDGCVLTLLNVFDEIGKAARDAAGWHACLDVLGHHLSGEQPPWDQGSRWAEVHATYVERFGPEADTIGPPEWAMKAD